MSTEAVIGLVLAALFVGALMPVLWQLRATLKCAQQTLESARHTLQAIDRAAPAARASLENIERLSATLAGDRSASSSALSVLSELLPVALEAFRAWRGDDDDARPAISETNRSHGEQERQC